MILPDESIARFLTDPLHSAFLIPEAQVLEGVQERLKDNSFNTFWCQATSDQLHFRALRVNLGRSKKNRQERLRLALTIVYDLIEDLVTFPGITRDRILPIVTPKTHVEIEKPEHKNRKKERSAREKRALEAYRPILEHLSQISGRAVYFHASGQNMVPPYPNDGLIHIVTNSCPPGEYQRWYLTTAFGMDIATGKERRDPIGNGPTYGRGVVLEDEDDKKLVQILGNTWYLLIPTLSYFNDATSLKIFEKLIALAWEAERKNKTKPPKGVTRSVFLGESFDWLDAFPDAAEDQIKKIRDDIAHHTKRLIELQRELAMHQNLHERLRESDFVTGTKARIPKDLRQIARHPLVIGITYYKDAIHVHTGMIKIEHKGKVYLTGSFTIRLSENGKLTIWGEETTHPDGIPHPHIGKHSGQCFGNAGTAITTAMAEARFADVVDYIFTWLQYGYTPDLAPNKIEEWPTEEVDA